MLTVVAFYNFFMYMNLTKTIYMICFLEIRDAVISYNHLIQPKALLFPLTLLIWIFLSKTNNATTK